MRSVLVSVLRMLRGVVASRAALHLEVPALRHQLLVLERSRPRRARLTSGSLALGVPVTCVERLANGTRHREAGNGRRLASPRISLVLDVEEASTHRPTARRPRCPRADSELAQENPLWCAPRYLIHDRDLAFQAVTATAKAM